MVGTAESQDHVDVVVRQWGRERPDLDVSPMEIVGRVSRASRLLERALREFFQSRGFEPWEFDVLATLRRSGAPYSLRVGQLLSSLMVNPPTLTNRLDRLVAKGLVDRAVDPQNRRSVVVTLTPAGLALVDEMVGAHVENEAQILSFMGERDRADLARLLRVLLIGLSDVT